MRLQEGKVLPQLEECRRRGPVARWLAHPNRFKRIAVAVAALMLFGLVTYGLRVWVGRSDARADSGELRHLTASLRAADRFSDELDAFKRVRKRTLTDLIYQLDTKREDTVRAVIERLIVVEALVPDLEIEIFRLRSSGYGAGAVEEKMRRLRASFKEMCGFTTAACLPKLPQIASSSRRAPGR